MNPASVGSNNKLTDGLRAVCDTPETLPDLCHHAEYRIHVNGQYVESVGSLGGNAQRALAFYRRRRRNQTLEVSAIPCRVPGCTWRPL